MLFTTPCTVYITVFEKKNDNYSRYIIYIEYNLCLTFQNIVSKRIWWIQIVKNRFQDKKVLNSEVPVII